MLLSTILAGLLTGKLFAPIIALAALGTTAVTDADAGADRDDDDGADAPESIADAGNKYLEGLPPNERERTFDDEEDEEIEPPPPAEAVTDDVEDGEDEEFDDDEAEPIVREGDGAIWNGKAKRWVLDGKFVDGDAPDGAAAEDEDEPATAPAKGKPKATAQRITLKGLADRGEEDLELEIDDKDIAARIVRLQNDSMRKGEYVKRLARLQEREADLEALDETIEADPVGFLLARVPRDQQREIARALVLEHYDALAEELTQFGEDGEGRERQRVALRDKIGESGKRLTRVQAAKRFARECVTAAEQLVPEGMDESRANRFLRAARAELAQASDAGHLRRAADVKKLLAPLVEDYGFTRRREEPPAPTGRKPAPPAARPVTDRARTLAARRPAASRSADPAAAQSQVRRVQDARGAARRVAPPGAGAAPTQVPTIPKEAEADIASASKYLRESGKLPDSWTPRDKRGGG
jgi:hypothetical protein